MEHACSDHPEVSSRVWNHGNETMWNTPVFRFVAHALSELLIAPMAKFGTTPFTSTRLAKSKGALPIKELSLSRNQIGDEGAVALAEAVGKGALPDSRTSTSTATRLATTAQRPSLRRLPRARCRKTRPHRQPDWRRGRGGPRGDAQQLYLAATRLATMARWPRGGVCRGRDAEEDLFKNQIGDDGAVALAEAVGEGALPGLRPRRQQAFSDGKGRVRGGQGGLQGGQGGLHSVWGVICWVMLRES